MIKITNIVALLLLAVLDDLVAGIDVEFGAVFAAARHEHERVRLLPQHVDPAARGAQRLGGFRETDDRHFRHGGPPALRSRFATR
jgi:hypothetical protein